MMPPTSNLFQDSTAQALVEDWLRTGDAAVEVGNHTKASSAYQEALRIMPNCLHAHYALSELRFSSRTYLDVLAQIHEILEPKNYIEIGVSKGASMARARPPTKCIGIDPAPNIRERFSAETQIFTMKSDRFFQTMNLDSILEGHEIQLGFIDGLHLFESALSDFINLERYCAPAATLLIHDCFPLDETTAARERTTSFWTGDVWRIIPLLHTYRPDLKITLIRCAPSGLAVVRNLDPENIVLSDSKPHIIENGMKLPFPIDEFSELSGLRITSSTREDVQVIFGLRK